MKIPGVIDPRRPLTARDFALTSLGTQQALHLLGRWAIGAALTEREEGTLDEWEEWLGLFLDDAVGAEWRTQEALV